MVSFEDEVAFIGRLHDLYFGVEKGIGHDLLADYDGIAGEYDLVVELYIVTSGGLSFAGVDNLFLGEGRFQLLVHLVYRAGLDLEFILSFPFFKLGILLAGLD